MPYPHGVFLPVPGSAGPLRWPSKIANHVTLLERRSIGQRPALAARRSSEAPRPLGQREIRERVRALVAGLVAAISSTRGGLIAALAVLSGVAACDDNGACEGGRPCECRNFDECFLECHDSDCDFRVHDLVHGGGVCEDDCHQLCFAVTDCSLACGDRCTSEVHDRCGVSAGADSHVSCHNATTCEIEVGPGSSVECHSVSTCRIDCAGNCQVQHTAVTGSPDIHCPASAPKVECSSTLTACGAC
jgi:hypothetical protein